MSLSITIPKQLNINGWIPVLYRKKSHYLMSILTTWANLETNNWLAAPPCGDVTDWAVIFTENQQLIKGLRRAPFQSTPEMEATKKSSVYCAIIHIIQRPTHQDYTRKVVCAMAIMLVALLIPFWCGGAVVIQPDEWISWSSSFEAVGSVHHPFK